MTNIGLSSLGATATESSSDPSEGPSHAGYAIDGYTGTYNGTNFVCTTTLSELSPWLRVDLQQSQVISAVQVFPRTDCCSNYLTNYRVVVGNNPSGPTASGNVAAVVQFMPNQISQITLLNFFTPLVGRYVWFYLVNIGSTNSRIVSICEFQIYTKAQYAWSQLSGQQNVALLKPTSQSSMETSFSGSASSRAVDGGLWNNYNTPMPGFGYTCSSTANMAANTPVWWRVDLGSVYSISLINVWGRLDCCTNRNTDIQIYVGNSMNWQANSQCNFNGNIGTQALPPSPNAIMTASISCPTSGRYVTFRRPNLYGGDSSILTLCEVQVIAQSLPNIPNPMSAMGAVYFRGNMVLFGGVDSSGFRSNSISLFNVDNLKFVPAYTPLGDVPIARSLMGFAVLDPGKLLVFGGTSNSDVITDALTLSFPACPAPSGWDSIGVFSKTCTGGGTSCVFVCTSQYTDVNNGLPLVCREDGIWTGSVPPCQPLVLASAPTSVSYVQTDATSVNITWMSPTSFGLPVGSSVQNYTVSATPDGLFERFVNGFPNGSAWHVNRPDVITASSNYFVNGRLYVDAGAGSDYWTGISTSATTGNTPVNPTRHGYVLYRDWPTNVNPNGEWTFETEAEAVQISDASGVSICMFDVGIPSTTPYGVSSGGEMQFTWGYRYTDGGAYGSPLTLALESLGGVQTEYIPLPTTLPRKVQLRIERSVYDETDREGNPIYRFWYRFHGAAQWVRVYTTITLYDTLYSPLGSNGKTRVGPGMIPSNLRPCFFTKTWNYNSYAVTTGAYTYISIFPGLSKYQGFPLPIQYTAPGVTSARLTGLSPSTTYRVTISAITQSGQGASSTLLLTTPAGPSPTQYTGPVVNAALQKTAFASSSNLGYGPMGPAAVNDGIWDTTNPALTMNFWNSNTANIYEWIAIDLGVPYAAVKFAFVVNRCSVADTADLVQRLRMYDFFIGSYNAAPRMDNVMTDYKLWGNTSGPMLTSYDPTIYGYNHRVWPTRNDYYWNYTYTTTNLQNCHMYLPTVGYGRYAYMLMNDAQWFHLRELNFFTANSCPARVASGNGWIVPQSVPGTRNCAANAGFGSICEYSCPVPSTVIVGALSATCNGEMWWSSSGSGAAPYCGIPCPDLAPPSFVGSVSVEMINENWSNWPTSTSDLRYLRFTSLYPWANVWTMFSIINGNLQSTSIIGSKFEASAVFSYTKANTQLDYTTAFTVSTTVSTPDGVGLYFRVVDENNWYRAVINPVTGYHYVESMVAGMLTIMTDAVDSSILPNVYNTLSVSVLGPAFNVSVNGRLLIQGADNSFTQGIIGLYARSTATFQSFVLTRTSTLCSGLTEGETCVMSCQSGLQSTGPNRRQCILSGTTGGWAIDPVANPFVCTLPPPSFPAVTISVPENSVTNAFVGSPLVSQSPSPSLSVQFMLKFTWWGMGPNALLCPDNSLFSVDSCTGQVRVRTSVVGALDFEIQPHYLLTVSAYISGFPLAYTDTNITVQLIDVDEPPIIISSVISFPENGGGIGTVVGLVQWWDPENDTVAFTVLVDGSGGRFAISQSSTVSQVTVIASPVNSSTPGLLTYFTGPSAPLSFEVPGSQGYQLSLRATQTLRDTNLYGTGTVLVQITDRNDPPIVPQQLVSISEASAAVANSSAVVGQVSAYDEDAGVTILTYTMVTSDLCLETNPARVPTQNSKYNGVPMLGVNYATGAITITAPPPVPYANNNQSTGTPYYPPFIYSSLSVRAVYTLCVNVSDGINVTIAPVTVAILANSPGLPRVTSWSPTAFDTSSKTNVTFFGQNLYIPGTNKVYRAYVSNGYTNLSLVGTPNTPTSMSFFPVAGLGQGLIWTITIDGQQVICNTLIQVSYFPPTITSLVNNVGFSTSSVTRVTINGQYFGNSVNMIEVYYGPTGWEYTCVYYSYQYGAFTCTVSNNAGGTGMQYRMRLGAPPGSIRADGYGSPGVTITTSDLWSYATPTVTSVSVYQTWGLYDAFHLPTQGGLTLLINGTQFGGASVPVSVSFGGQYNNRYQMTCSKPLSSLVQTSIVCTTPVGTGQGLGLIVNVAGNPSAVFMAGGVGLAFNPPSIYRVYGPGWQSASTAGGQVINVDGADFGPVGGIQTVTLTYGHNSSEVTLYSASSCVVMISLQSVSTIQCYSSPGIGTGLVYQVTVDSQSSPVFNGKGSYGAPVISLFSGTGATAANTIGGDQVIISGLNFGPLNAYSQSQLSVFYGVTLIEPIKNTTSGVLEIGSVSYSAASCSITVAHTQITCLTVAGAGTNLHWDVVLAGQHSTTPTTTYAAPVIQSITDVNGNPVTSANVNGGTIVLLNGQFFGPSAYIPNWSLVQEVSFGVSGSEYSIPAASLINGVPDDSVAGWSVPAPGNSVIRVRLPAGFGTNLYFRVSVADQMSTSSPTALFSFMPPQIISVNPNSATTYSNPSQPTTIQLTTTGLPFLDPTARIGVLLGNYPYQQVLTASLPVGLSQLAAATNSSTGAVSFSVTLPTNGGGLLQSFQLTVTSASASINSPPSAVSPIGSNSVFNYYSMNVEAVVLTRARFIGSSSVSSGTTNTDLIPCPFSPSDPIFSCTDPSNPVYQMSILGTDFTSLSATQANNDGLVRSADILLSNSTYLGIIWSTTPIVIYSWEHTRIVLLTTLSSGTVRLQLTNVAWNAPNVTQVVIRTFQELNPEISDLTGPSSNIPTAGGSASTPLIISVTNLAGCSGLNVYFGPYGNRTMGTILDSTSTQVPYPPLTTDAAVAAWVQGQTAAASNNNGIYYLYVQIPPGQGSSVSVVVSKRSGGSPIPMESNSGFIVSYSPPVLSQVQVFTYGVAGPLMSVTPTTSVTATTEGVNTVIYLIGSNLGTAPSITSGDAVVSFGTACPNYALYTCYQFVAPWGEGTGAQIPNGPYTQSLPFGYRMWLTAGDQSTSTVGFQYAIPVVSSIVSLTGTFPTLGGVGLLLYGSNFGATRVGRPPSTKLVEFGYASDNTTWRSCSQIVRFNHSTLSCILPPGVGINLNVRVTMADLVNPSAISFSYDPPAIYNISVYRVSGLITNVLWTNSTIPLSGNTTTVMNGNFTLPLSGYNRPMLTGKSSGGDILYISGTNFGPFASYSCACLMWSFRPTVGLSPICDGWESFWGEGEIPSSNILLDANGTPMWSDNRIVIQTPPGIGWKDLELSIRGQTLGFAQLTPNVYRFQYDAPSVVGTWSGDMFGLTDNTFPFGPPKTLYDTDGELVTIFGSNFGPTPRNMTNPSLPQFSSMNSLLVPSSQAYTIPTANLAVVFNQACISIASTLFGAVPSGTITAGSYSAQLSACSSNILHQRDDRITLITGQGIGKNLQAFIVIVDGSYSLASAIIPFSYYPPLIQFFQPQIVRMGNTGSTPVEIFGRYYGDPSLANQQGWSASQRLVLASIGGITGSCDGDVTRQSSSIGTYLLCLADEALIPAGARNVSVTVAGQTGVKAAVDQAFGSLLIVCDTNYYGRVNETCLPCPSQNADPSKTGATCRGYNDDTGTAINPVVIPFEQRLTYPVPNKGFYNLNSSDMYTLQYGGQSMLSVCPEGYQGSPQDRTRDVCIVPCDPQSSCLGDNICAEGYTSKPPLWRCAYCDKGYYKRSGACIKCPNSPAALFIGFILLVVVIAIVGFMMNRKQVNIAVISIGVDFFQVLAIFAEADIAWPPVIVNLLHVLSAFNLNIEIVAPECLIPSVSYKQKFWFIMLLPLCITFLFGLYYTSILLYKALIQGQPKRTWHTHKPALISSCLVLVYLLYLYLTRTVFDVFNCAPTYPPTYKPDGSTIMYLQVVFPEECGVKGGTQLTLLPYAIAGLVVYSFGYPLFIGSRLFKNRELVMEDQLLRAKGTGQDKLTNPRAYDFRCTYGRSYFQFKPDWCMWILAIILRKFCIAITAVVFGKNSSFQMAACLLIMFLAYAAQVQIRPYMSPGDCDEVLKSHLEHSYTSAVHARLRASLAGIETRGRKKGHKNLINFEGNIDRSAVLGVLTGFFFNYNTVEAIMTFCAVIVSLMAIMYEANTLNTYYPQSQDSVTSVVLIVVIWAICYFATVLITEIVVLYNEDARAKQLAKIAKSNRSKTDPKSVDNNKRRISRLVDENGEMNLGKVETGLNPMFLKKGSSGESADVNAGGQVGVDAILSQVESPPVELWRVFQSSYASMNDQLSLLREQLGESRKREQESQVASNSGETRVPKKSRALFAPTSSSETVNPLGSRTVALSSIRGAKSFD